jgi:hypothetical protein
MAKLIDKTTVKNGRIIQVWNTARKKFSNAKKKYFAVWVEDANGKNERCLLFTEKEIKRAEYRASRNKEDLTEKNLITDIFD